HTPSSLPSVSLRTSPQSYVPSRFFFSHATPPSVTSPLSLHDALPIWFVAVDQQFRADDFGEGLGIGAPEVPPPDEAKDAAAAPPDRKSTRLNSSHVSISYAVFCLKKKSTDHGALVPNDRTDLEVMRAW